MKLKKIILWSFLVLLGVFLAYIWYGFTFPDPYYLSKFTLIDKLICLWFPRLLIPLFYLVLIILVTIKNRKLAQNIALVIFTFLILAIIFYPVLDIIYFFKTQLRTKVIKEQYHPYLQLKPILPDKLDYPYGENTIKIFCLGGSTTEFKDSKGIGWPDRLEKELRQIYHSDSIFVFNLGRQWYTTLHSLINYETNLRKYKPDVIILMHNINDFLQNADFSYLSNNPFRQDYGHFMGPSVNIFRCNGLFGTHWPMLNAMWYHTPRMTYEQDFFPGLESFTRNINTLIDLVSIDSTKVILLTQPNIFSDNMNDNIKNVCNMVNYEAVGKDKRWGFQTAYVGMKQYNDRIKNIAEKKKVYFIDLEKSIPKSLIYFHDEVHYRDTTFNIISKTLVEEIARLKIDFGLD